MFECVIQSMIRVSLENAHQTAGNTFVWTKNVQRALLLLIF